MPGVSLSNTLRHDYETLFNSCTVRPQRAAEVDDIVGALLANKPRYESVARTLGVPWYFVAVIHNMEAGLSFARHLHNGDLLTARTVQVPPGRPVRGQPPFTWEESAVDALAMRGVGPTTDWRLAGVLHQLERYNGWGYRRRTPPMPSPYLWSFSSHYTRGKYVADGQWSETATSRQCGAAVLLRRLAERGDIDFADQPAPAPGAPPLVPAYATDKPPDAAVVARVEMLQRWLNTFPGVFVKVDGVPGPRTSGVYKLVAGRYLPGDPRET